MRRCLTRVARVPTIPAMPRAFPFAVLFLSGAAHASFGGGPCRDFGCHLGVLATALMASVGQTTIGHNESYPWIGLVPTFPACAAASVLYARSSPHGPGGA